MLYTVNQRTPIEKFLDSVISQTRVEVIDGKKVAVKRYSTAISVKWFFIVNSFRSYPFVALGKERMRRELDFMLERWRDLEVPRVLDFDLEEEVVIRQYIEASNEEIYYELGKGLRVIHNAGYVMGDTKPSNFIVTRRRVYVIDAEQAIRQENEEYRAWDVLVILMFMSYRYINNLKSYLSAARALLTGYEVEPTVLRNLFNMKFLGLISLFPPLHLMELRKLLSELGQA
jgi:tRNA A-37 threonylcarbamoyl transferase component Bud32